MPVSAKAAPVFRLFDCRLSEQSDHLPTGGTYSQQSVDMDDREKVGLLLEMDEGLTTDWDVMKRVYNQFDKQHKWNDARSSSTGPTIGRMTREVLTRSDEMSRRFESGPTPTNCKSYLRKRRNC